MKEEPKLVIPESLLRLPRVSTVAFLEKVCREVTDQALVHIAKCDYEMDVDENLVALRRIKKGVGWDEPLSWIPLEVLSLHRWGEANENGEMPDREYKLSVLFASLALHYMGDDVENVAKNSPDILLPMIEASLTLGEEYMEGIRGAIVNVLEQSKPWEEHTLFWIFGLLSSIALDPQFDDTDVIHDVGLWLVELSDESLEWFSAMSPGAVTFLDLQYQTILEDRFKSLASQIVAKGLIDDKVRSYLLKVIDTKTKSREYEGAFEGMSASQKVRIFFEMVKMNWRMIWGKW